MKYDWDLQAASSRRALRVGMLVGSTSIAGGGVSEAVRSLALALARVPNVTVEIFAPDDGRGQQSFGSIPVRLAPIRGPSSFAYAPRLVADMLKSELDVVHVHGLWMYISVAARRWARITKKPYIVSPHGMLDPWALRNNGTRKTIARLLYEGAHLEDAACLHALCRAEADAIRRSVPTAPISVVPNGVDLPTAAAAPAEWRMKMPPGAKVALFFGRVTPKKQVVNLVRGFGRQARATDSHLVIAGPVADGYRAEIDAAIADTPCGDRIHVVGPAYGEARASAYASADMFVLPSISEGLPMAALEAFSHGVPALLTRQCNIPEAFEHGAALEIRPTEEGIAEGFGRVFAMKPEDRIAMGRDALRLATDVFNWNTIAVRMADLYVHLKDREDHSFAYVRTLTGRAGLPA